MTDENDAPDSGITELDPNAPKEGDDADAPAEETPEPQTWHLRWTCIMCGDSYREGTIDHHPASGIAIEIPTRLHKCRDDDTAAGVTEFRGFIRVPVLDIEKLKPEGEAEGLGTDDMPKEGDDADTKH